VFLAYCTNIHPAESWDETFAALRTTALQVRDMLRVTCPQAQSLLAPFPLAPRLSARAAAELRSGNQLSQFRDWLQAEQCEVFTINGFPYGAFHGTRVKEMVYRPDWTDPARYTYTLDLFYILTELLPAGKEGSVSTLPGSFKAFAADDSRIIQNLIKIAYEIETLAISSGHDLHLGLEPEPLGHFENTIETLAFFERLFTAAGEDADLVGRRIGVNYDTCHFALEFDDCLESLNRLRDAGIRISKVHLSAAIEIDPHDATAIAALQSFAEPTYLHQVLLRSAGGSIRRFSDLPDFFATLPARTDETVARVHFHIPLDTHPVAPLRTTQDHARDLLAYWTKHPDFCRHFEIETYTWGVLPDHMQRPLAEHIAAEYRWVLQHILPTNHA
jgi:hypothetical protein